MFLKWDIILFTILAIGINVLTYMQRDTSFFLYFFAQLLLGICFLIVLVASLIINSSHSKQNFRSFFFGLLLALSFPLFSYLTNVDRNKKIILEANAGGDLTTVQLDLHDDHTFTLYNGGPMGGDYYRGNYQLNNDTLKLDNGDKNLYPTLTFVMKNDTALKSRYFDPTGTENTFYKLYIRENKLGR